VIITFGTKSVRDNRGIVKLRLNAWAISNYLDPYEYTVEPPFNVHQLKILPPYIVQFQWS
jgi:hypothetical protein